jgi:hypothetical protein
MAIVPSLLMFVPSLANMSKRARPAYLRQIIGAITNGIGAPGEKVDEEGRDISCLGMYTGSRQSSNQCSSQVGRH